MPMCGGLNDAQAADGEIQAICDQVSRTVCVSTFLIVSLGLLFIVMFSLLDEASRRAKNRTELRCVYCQELQITGRSRHQLLHQGDYCL